MVSEHAEHRNGREEPARRRPRGWRWLSASVLTVALLAVPTLAGAASATAGDRQAMTASAVKLTGTYIEVHGEDRLSEQTLQFLDVGGSRVQLHFKSKPKKRLQPMSKITVSGTQSGKQVTVDSSSTVAAAPAAGPTTGTRNLLVILVKWGTTSLTATPTTASNFVFGTDKRSTDQWYHDASYNQLNWDGDVTPVLTISGPGSCDPYYGNPDLDGIAASARTAAINAGYDPDSYSNVMIDHPLTGCGASAWGEIGGRYTWIPNGLVDLTDGYVRLAPVHELGHNLGLNHSHGLECNTVAVSNDCLASSSSIEEYGNAWDVMGNNWPGDELSGVAEFGARQRQQLGWFTNRTQTVTTSGQYVISPLELATAGNRQAVEIDTGLHVYDFELRQALGQDSFFPSNATNGVQVNMRNDTPYGDTGPLNLDLAPNSDLSSYYSDFFDSSLDLGQSFTDPDGAFTITVTAVSATSATLSVQFANRPPPPTCVPGTPVVTAASRYELTVSIPACVEPGATTGSTPTGMRLSVYENGDTAPSSTQDLAMGTTQATVSVYPFFGPYRLQLTAFNSSGYGPNSAFSAPAPPPFATLDALITQQYRDFAGRVPTAAELSDWRTKLTTGTVTPAGMINSAVDFPYWAKQNAVIRLFRAYFLRLPDIGGLNYWTNRSRSGTTLATISQSFASSSEFRNRYGALSNRAFVDLVYQNVLGRAPDQAGSDYWTGRLDAGTTRGTVMIGFSESSEYRTATRNLVDVVNVYTGMLRRVPTQAEADTRVAWLRVGNTRTNLIGFYILVSEEYDNRV